MPQMTEWLKLMLSEISRKREEAERANDEDAKRLSEQSAMPGAALPLKKSG